MIISYVLKTNPIKILFTHLYIYLSIYLHPLLPITPHPSIHPHTAPHTPTHLSPHPLFTPKMSSKKSDYKKIPLQDLSTTHINTLVHTFGWTESSHTVGKAGTFIILSSAFSTLKCFYPNKIDLTRCTSVNVYGEIKINPTQHKDNYEFEMQVHELTVFGCTAPPFPLNKESTPFTQLEYGHLALRTKERKLFLQARAALLKIARDFFYTKKYTEVTPPTLVQTQVEGGSTLFKLKYYDTDAYLTQSSQLYLETVAPVVGKAYCIMPSYRAEKSNSVRHLSEYTHVEAELADVTFEDLLTGIEDLVVYCITEFYKEMGSKISESQPDFEFMKLSGRLRRIKYADAIEFLREKEYLKEDLTPFVLGDDIPDAAERYLVENVGKGEPLFLTHFPVSLKPFYMRKEGDFTESCDLLFPGVGEILGGSMRCESYDEVMEGFKREGIDTTPYYWYTDMLRYGPCSHGGYGLGFERLLMGLMKYKSINKACLYPRFVTRCAP